MSTIQEKQAEPATEQTTAMAKAHWKRGNGFAKEGKVGQAIAEYQQALCLDSTNAKYQLSLGIAYTSKSNRKKAVACLRQALPLVGNNKKNLGEINYYLGLNLSRLGDYLGAERALLIAVRHWPDKPHSHHELGHVYNKQLKPQLARDEYWRALELSANAPVFDIACCYMGLGNALWLGNHPEAALDKYAEAFRLCPSLAGLNKSLFLVLMQQGKIIPALLALAGKGIG